MRWVVGYGLYLVSETSYRVLPAAWPYMSSSTRYDLYPTPAHLITNKIIGHAGLTYQQHGILCHMYQPYHQPGLRLYLWLRQPVPWNRPHLPSFSLCESKQILHLVCLLLMWPWKSMQIKTLHQLSFSV